MNRQIFKIRAHHGLCLCFFQGKGYSEGFVKNMASVKRKLEQNPLVCIVEEADIICEKCPNLSSGSCRGERTVSAYDRQVLLRCGISSGDCIPYQEFRQRIQEHILQPQKRREICGGCQWETLCDGGNHIF